MRSLAIICPLLLAGCSSLPPAELRGMSVEPWHPPVTIERPWLMPRPKDEVILFDSRTLQALRKLDEYEALNQNAGGRVRHPGMWAGIGVGAFAGAVLVTKVVDDVSNDAADFWECFFDSLFGGDCDGE